MTSASTAQAIVFGLFLFFFAYMGYTYRTTDSSEYHTVGRNAGWLRIVASLFAVVGASEYVFFAGLVHSFGWQALLFFVGALLGFLALSQLAHLIRSRAAELDHHSIPDFAATKGLRIGAVALSIASILFTFSLVLLQTIIGGLLIAQITGLTYPVAAAAVCLTLALYLVWGGYRALLNTDVVQALVMLIVTIYLATFLADGKGFRVFFENTPAPEIGWIDVIVFSLGGFFAIFGGPEIWQRVVTAKSTSLARWSLAGSGVLMLLWGFFLIAVSLSIKASLPETNADDAFFKFLSSDLVSPVALGFVVVMLLSALLSTADTELFAAAVVIRKIIGGTATIDSVRPTQYIIVALCVLAFTLSLLTQDLVTIYLSIVYLAFITGPTGLALLLGRGTDATIAIGIFGSAAIGIYLVASGMLTGWYPLLILVPQVVPFALRQPSKA